MQKNKILPLLIIAGLEVTYGAAAAHAEEAAGIGYGVTRKLDQGSNVLDIQRDDIRGKGQLQQENPQGVVRGQPLIKGKILPLLVEEEQPDMLLHKAEPAPVPEHNVRAVPSRPMVRPSVLSSPDERPLWAMYNAGQYEPLAQRLQSLQKQYPRWRPSSELVALLTEKLLDQYIAKARAAEDWKAIVHASQEYPQAFSCQRIDHAWDLLNAYAQLGMQAQLESKLQAVVRDCGGENRITTLQKARAWLTEEQWGALLTQSAPLFEGSVAGAYQQLVFDHEKRELQIVLEQGRTALVEQKLTALMPKLELARERDMLLQLGWYQYQQQNLAASVGIFSKLLDWNSQDTEAAQGLALSYMQQRRFEDVVAIAQQMPEGSTKQELLHHAHIGMANQAYDAGNWDGALRQIVLAQESQALSREVKMLQAWSRLHAGDAAQAQADFLSLYQARPDQDSATGLINSYRSSGWSQLQRHAGNEPLAGMLRTELSQQAFDRKQFILAKALDATTYGDMGATMAPNVMLGAGYRDKSGETGLSRLRIKHLPLVALALPVDSNTEITFDLRRVELDAGSVRSNALIGYNPGNNWDKSQWRYQPTDSMQGYEPQVTLRRETSTDQLWEFSLGATPTNGAVSIAPTGHIQNLRFGEHSRLLSTLYMTPIRESILSYTGIRDPYTGKEWGRVIRHGLGMQYQHDLRAGWGVNFAGNAEYIKGSGVEGNTRLALYSGIGRNLQWEDFSYAVLGAGIHLDHYAKNLSHFTWGHGGYFSPRSFVGIGPTFDFMTAENRQFLLKGRLSVGYAWIKEASAPFYPSHDDGSRYAADSKSGMQHSLELMGVWRINDRMQFGASFVHRDAPQYRDHAVLFEIRLIGAPKKSVLSSDLPVRNTWALF